jgi:UDP-N-acetylmuramyl tripeptide synthase
LVRILRMKHLQWQNICSPRPVVLADLALGAAFDWTAVNLTPAILAILREKFPYLPIATAPLDAAQLVAEIAQELQTTGDISPRGAGVISRDAKTHTAMLYFSGRDFFLAQAVLVAAARLVRKLCASTVTAATLSHQLERCFQDVHRVALKPPTCAMLDAAEKREIPWFRVDHMSQDIRLGQGAKQRRLPPIRGLEADTPQSPQAVASPPSVASAILESIYPKDDDGRIPTAMITGSVGKTTTSLMLRSILTAAGHIVGAATTMGVTIGDAEVITGDVAGTSGAEAVLHDPTVTAAVLETARGDLLVSGMYLDRCDVGALLNVDREQIGMDCIDTLDQMAEHKRKVVDAAAAAVLNGNDERCLAIAREIRGTKRTILFSPAAESACIKEHIEWGAEGIYVRPIDGIETIVIESQASTIPVIAVTDIPATMGGLVAPNVWNAMAACGLAHGLGIAMRHIRQGLRRYQISDAVTGARFHFPDGFPVKILFDRASSPPALSAAMAVVDAIKVEGKRICATAVPGHRATWHVDECAKCLAGHFNIYVCYGLGDRMRRIPQGMTPEDLAARMARGLEKAGVDARAIRIVKSRKDAAHMIAHEAHAGDLVAVFGPGKSIEEYRKAFGAVA